MSKTKIKSVNYSIYQFMKNQRGKLSHATFYERTKRLETIAKELHKLGYETTNIGRIKQKHVEILVKHWQDSGLSIGTIKNRMSDLRFVCKELNRTNVVKNNDDYNIGKRSYILTDNKAMIAPALDRVEDDYIRCSIELQRVFGLRREECLKIIPSQAIDGNRLHLKSTWTKGGIARSIPIKTAEQVYWINYAKNLVVKDKSLIPNSKNYIEHRRYYDKVTARAGLKNLHGLRHAYAQNRYLEITGWQSPIKGGKSRNQLSKQEWETDQIARKIIASELGHSRIAIAKNYLG